MGRDFIKSDEIEKHNIVSPNLKTWEALLWILKQYQRY